MIRKTLTALGVSAASGLLVLGATGVASADAGASQFCAGNNNFGTTHGACVSFFENGNLTAAIANACKDPNVQAFFGDDNVGQCVKDLKALIAT